MKFLKSYPTKKITLEMIEKHGHYETYQDLYHAIDQAIQINRLKPIKAQGTNGKNPTLYKSYFIVGEQEDVTHLKEELSYRIHPLLKVDYYLTNLEMYKQDRPFVLQLSDFLTHQRFLLTQEISLNERSFQIWGREKFLQLESGKRILKNVAFDLKDLNCYETAEPIAYFTRHKRSQQAILIIENKDTFYSMRNYLLVGHTHILGLEIGTLMYGAGKGVCKAFSYFSQSVEPYLLEPGHTFYYFGDLDYEGILIYEKLSECFECIPFIRAYELMMEKSKNYCLPLTKEGQNRNIGNIFLKYFEKDRQEEIISLLELNRYIPQECLNRYDF